MRYNVRELERSVADWASWYFSSALYPVQLERAFRLYMQQDKLLISLSGKSDFLRAYAVLDQVTDSLSPAVEVSDIAR